MHRKLVATLSALLAAIIIFTAVPLPSYGQASTATPTQTGTAIPQATTTITTTAILTPAPAIEPTAAPSPTSLPAAADRFYPETGLTVPAVFVKYWDANGGLPVFGFPISEARIERNLADNKDYLVQYFERNRFEYHPEFKDTPNEVLLGLLGVELTRTYTFQDIALFDNTPTKIYIDETKHSLSEPFLSYWRNHGGLAIFGYPISEPFEEKNAEDGKTYLVQYFQRNRFEYHPENQPPYDVLLGLLGRDILEVQNAMLAWGPPVAGGMALTQPVMKPAKPAVGKEFVKGPHVGDGMIVQLFYQDKERILNMVNDLDFGWVTQQVEWKETEDPKGAYHFDELERVVNAAQAHRLKVMLTVTKAPAWATGGFHGFPKNPQDMGDFMKALATRFKGRVQAYQIWNEQNLTGESGEINPGRYVELLKAAYTGVKSVDTGAVIISGALAPTGVNDPLGKREPGAMGVLSDPKYLEEMYLYNKGEVRGYFDVLGTHPYGFNNPPDTKWPENPNTALPVQNYYNRHNSFYFRRIEEQRTVMEKYGDGIKQMWVTEYGWCSDYREDGYGECKYVTQQQQGQYIVAAMQRAKKLYPWMGVMFLWNLNFSTFQPWYTGPSHFSILNGDWSARPAYFAIKNRPRN